MTTRILPGTEPSSRLPPEIVFVPPPPGPVIRPFVFILCFGILAAVGLFLSVGLVSTGRTTAWVLVPLIVLAVIFSPRLLLWRNRAHAAQRREFLEKRPPDESDPLVTALAAAWKVPGRLPKLEDVRTALEQTEGASGEGRPRVLCFGEPDIPEVGELYFEPEIVTPTGAVWKQLFWVPIALAVLVWWLLDYLGLLPPRVPSIRFLLGSFAFVFVAALIVLITWFWHGMIRPTYLRMAPGIIQVLEYRFWRSRPTIRSYPMEPGTLVFFTRLYKRHLLLTLAREQFHDSFLLSRMRHSKRVIERTWQALLSTTPTPPLSDEQLVG